MLPVAAAPCARCGIAPEHPCLECRGGIAAGRGVADRSAKLEVILFSVMAGLVPAIHVFLSRAAKTWMPGTRPGMTSFATEPYFIGCLCALVIAPHYRGLFEIPNPFSLAPGFALFVLLVANTQ